MNCNLIPRPEYPRPQMVRNEWVNLNGRWEFEIDYGKSGRDRKLYLAEKLNGEIIVPFCPESSLSGVGHKDFMQAVWYRREFVINEDWKDGRILLHFGAVDYQAEVWINGKSAVTHKGGYSSFTFDITGLINPNINIIIVCAEDDVRSGKQPRGKQSGCYHSVGCDYTRTTGIWQTVWLEYVPKTYIKNFRLVPDPVNKCVHIEAALVGDYTKCSFEARAFINGMEVGSQDAAVSGHHIHMTLKLNEIYLWEPGKPFLYDLQLKLLDDAGITDHVESYFGLRTVKLGKNAVLINGKPLFQKLVLDQGYHKEGIYTAPTEEDLKRDIELAMQMGFNGARLHQKVFEPRYLYWADKMGYLVWGEQGSWGLNITNSDGLESFLPEWLEVVERDFNHPSIVVWCPFNETWDWDFLGAPDGSWDPRGTRQNDNILRIVYTTTKMLDSTRPVIDTSGNYHVVTDIFDIHDYEQDHGKFAAKFEGMKTGAGAYVNYSQRQKYAGQPYMVSEYGGIWWNRDSTDDKSWGYGSKPQNEEEFIKRYEGLTKALLENPAICGFCYTQLYDVEQEANGLYTYERRAKFDPAAIRAINLTKAAIEG